MPFSNNVIPLNNTIWNEFRYIPYSIHNAHPMQYMVYVNQESPDTFRVLIDFIVWGKNAIVVQKPHA